MAINDLHDKTFYNGSGFLESNFLESALLGRRTMSLSSLSKTQNTESMQRVDELRLPKHLSHTNYFLKQIAMEDEILELKKTINELNEELKLLRPSKHVSRRKKTFKSVASMTEPKLSSNSPKDKGNTTDALCHKGFNSNKNPPHQEEKTENVRKLLPVMGGDKKTDVEEKTQIQKKRVLLLGASHCKGTGTIIKELLPNHECLTVSKPGAKLHDIVKGIEGLTKDFTINDTVIIQGTTNDINPSDPYPITIQKAMTPIFQLSTKCKFKILSIPYRYDLEHLNSDIWTANRLMQKFCESYRIQFVEVQLPRPCYTKHGLHFNGKGKKQLLRHVVALTQNATYPGNIQEASEDHLLKAANPPNETKISVVMGRRFDKIRHFDYPAHQQNFPAAARTYDRWKW